MRILNISKFSSLDDKMNLSVMQKLKKALGTKMKTDALFVELGL